MGVPTLRRNRLPMDLIQLAIAGITLIASGIILMVLPGYAGGEKAIGDWGPCPQGGEHQWGSDGETPARLKCVKCGAR